MESWDQAHARHPLDEVGGTLNQRGSGDFSLCNRCNSNTGAWYVKEYTSWAYQAAEILSRTNGDPRLFCYYHGFPLRFYKQVVAMLASIAGPPLTRRHRSLRRFLLNRHNRDLDPLLRVYAFYNPGTRIRRNAMASIFNSTAGYASTFTEFVAFPFGFVLTDDSPPPDPTLTEITHLSEFGYDEFRSVPLRLPSYPVVAHFPGIYHPASVVKEMRKPEDK